MGGQGPFQLPIIECVNKMAMAAGHLDAGSVIDEPLSNSEDCRFGILLLRDVVARQPESK